MSVGRARQWRVGDNVRLPDRYQLKELLETPGRVESVDSDWVMVDMGRFGVFGLPAADLIKWH